MVSPFRHRANGRANDSSPQSTRDSLKPSAGASGVQSLEHAGPPRKPGDEEGSNQATARTSDEEDSKEWESLAKQARRSWMAKDSGMQNNQDPVTPKTARERWGATNGDDLSPVQSPGFKSLGFQNARRKWDDPKSKLDGNLLAPASWHGGRKKWTPPKPQGSMTPDANHGKKKWGPLNQIYADSPGSTSGENTLTAASPRNKSKQDLSAFPITESASSKFASIISPPDLNSSMSSILTLPPVPQRRRYSDDNMSKASTRVLRGNRLYRIEEPAKHVPHNFIPRQSKSSHTTPHSNTSWIKNPPKEDKNAIQKHSISAGIQSYPSSLGIQRHSYSSGILTHSNSSGVPHRPSCTVDDEPEVIKKSSTSSCSFMDDSYDQETEEIRKNSTNSFRGEEDIDIHIISTKPDEDDGPIPKRSDSGSSFDGSIDTYADEDDNADDEKSFEEDEEKYVRNNSFDDPALIDEDEDDDIQFMPLKGNPTLVEEEEESLSEHEEELHEEEQFVVDKVPKKRRWTSSNSNPNYSPIWPPIIKVQNYERRNVSGISVGSGFTTDDSLTDSQDFLSSIGDEITEEEILGRPPERRTSYRIRYDGPTTFKRNAEIHNLPRVQHDDRFEHTSEPPDGAPHMPSRPRDSIVDSTPCAPPRRQSSMMKDDDLSIDLELINEKSNRPDVWITPSSGTTPYEAMWKVKRVWAMEKQDEEEDEHSVDKQELFQKIKALVGAPESPPPKDGMPTMPSRSWHIQTVVERRGKLEGLEAAKEVDDEEFETNINVMAEEAVKEIETNVKAIEEIKKRKELEKDIKDTDDKAPAVDKASEQVADKTLPLEVESESPAVQETSPLPEKKEKEVTQVEVTPEVQESSTEPALVKAIEEAKKRKELEKEIKETDDKASEQVADENLPLEVEPESPAVQEMSPLPEKEEEEVIQVEVTPEVQESSVEPAPEVQEIEVATEKPVPLEPTPEMQESEVAPEKAARAEPIDEGQESVGDADAQDEANIPAGRGDDESPAPVEVTKEGTVDVTTAGERVEEIKETEETDPVIPGLSDLEEEPNKSLDVSLSPSASKRKEKKGKSHKSQRSRKSKASGDSSLSPKKTKKKHTKKSKEKKTSKGKKEKPVESTDSPKEEVDTPVTPKRFVVPMTAMVHDSSSSEIDYSEGESEDERSISPKEDYKAIKTPSRNMIRASAMVHESDSELSISSDEDSDSGPKVASETRSPRSLVAVDAAPWWKKEGSATGAASKIKRITRNAPNSPPPTSKQGAAEKRGRL